MMHFDAISAPQHFSTAILISCVHIQVDQTKVIIAGIGDPGLGCCGDIEVLAGPEIPGGEIKEVSPITD